MSFKPFFAKSVLACVLSLIGASCTSIMEPMNAPSTLNSNQSFDALDASNIPIDDTIIGLSFSGGGTRAAAFAYGVLAEMATVGVENPGSSSLLDKVDFVSGVSGGSIIAAYFALKGAAALTDFRERFLLADVESHLRTAYTPTNVARLIGGGVNDQSGLPAWLNQNLFNGATFGDILRKRRPVLWINASDIYNRNPFIFDRETFAALCSDYESYPIAEAVAASAAVPLAFSPIVVQNHAKSCAYQMPSWTVGALEGTNAPAGLKSYAQGISRYREDPTLNYIKLLDGGLADNFGLQGFILARARAQEPFAPLSPRQAIAMKRFLFLVIDAGRPVKTDFQKTLGGHNGLDLILAATDTAINSTVRISFDSFSSSMNRWQEDVIRYRCSLSQRDVSRIRTKVTGWNCRDVKFYVGRIAFEQINNSELLEELKDVDTSLVLPAGQVNLVTDAARLAMRQNPSWNAFVQSLDGRGPAITGLERLEVTHGGKTSAKVIHKAIAQ